MMMQLKQERLRSENFEYLVSLKDKELNELKAEVERLQGDLSDKDA